MLIFALLLLVSACGGEEAEAPGENAPKETASIEPAPAKTAPEKTAPTAEPDTSQAYTLNIVNSFGERAEMEVEIADSPEEQQRGLMERTALDENAGMLFVFDGEQPRSFTMRNTLIPLSIAFIDAEGIIVNIQDMQPLANGPYLSGMPARYALEANQGFFANRGIGLGDVVELPGRPGLLGTVGPDAVVQMFQNAGLEVGETYPVEEEPGWQETRIPKSYAEALRFKIPSLEGDAGGRIFVFGSEEDLAAVRDYYERLVPSVRPHLYVEGQMVLQITNQLPKADADRYGAVLKETV
ncbi:MAG TPA: DUF192 domain-containing protein [Rubrobacteraceae bacterium]|jgi:hypothetical protein|nr:DUF192 domain-containing protein [Rubrobacteraceae bacterium]